MKYAEFLKVASVLKPEEAKEYTLLKPWAGSERVQINDLKIDNANPDSSRVKITAKFIIVKTLRLKHLRVDSDGGVYLHTDIYVGYDWKLAAERNRAERAEVEQELADHKREFADFVADEKLTQKTGESSIPTGSTEPPLPDVPAEQAVGKQLQQILEHNEFLKAQGRAEEQVIPF